MPINLVGQCEPGGGPRVANAATNTTPTSPRVAVASPRAARPFQPPMLCNRPRKRPSCVENMPSAADAKHPAARTGWTSVATPSQTKRLATGMTASCFSSRLTHGDLPNPQSRRSRQVREIPSLSPEACLQPAMHVAPVALSRRGIGQLGVRAQGVRGGGQSAPRMALDDQVIG